MTRLGSPLRLSRSLVLLVPVLLLSTLSPAQSPSRSTVDFGNVQVGGSSIMPITISNTGKSSATVNQVTVSGASFTFVGPTLPIVIPAHQKAQLSGQFAPLAPGAFSGTGTAYYVTTVDGHNYNGTMTANLVGTGVAGGYLSAPGSLGFGSVTVGSSQSQSLTVSNTGGSTLTISNATITGSAFTFNGLSLPYTLSPGSSTNLSITFSPTKSRGYNETLTLTSDASDPTVNVSLTGTGTASNGTLAVAPASINFGNVTIGSSQTQNGTVTANGGSLTLTSATSNNAAFTIAGLSLPLNLTAGQSAPFSVTFAPTKSGAASATISFVASNSSSAIETASGAGTTIQHIVGLSWNASSSGSIAGYNVYRANSSSGPFSKINSVLDPLLDYSDNTVQSGNTYYYATTAVDTSGEESSYSNLTTAAIPFP
jgi:hypothetical protein